MARGNYFYEVQPVIELAYVKHWANRSVRTIVNAVQALRHDPDERKAFGERFLVLKFVLEDLGETIPSVDFDFASYADGRII